MGFYTVGAFFTSSFLASVLCYFYTWGRAVGLVVLTFASSAFTSLSLMGAILIVSFFTSLLAGTAGLAANFFLSASAETFLIYLVFLASLLVAAELVCATTFVAVVAVALTGCSLGFDSLLTAFFSTVAALTYTAATGAVLMVSLPVLLEFFFCTAAVTFY